jgi:hypothetical protein
MSGLMFFSSVMLMTALADIREGRVLTANLNLRVKSIETALPLQFEAIKEWRTEIKESLDLIRDRQKSNARSQTSKSDTIIKGQKKAAATKTKVSDLQWK